MISPNFKLAEIAVRRKGKYQVVQSHAIRKLQQLRERVGHSLTINSGFRSPVYNAEIDGATKSRHMYGDAFDIQPNPTSRDAMMQHCRDLGAGYVAKYQVSTHVHCDWRSDPLDGSFYGSSSARVVEEDKDSWSVYDLRADIVEDDGVYSVEASGYDEHEGELARDWIAYDADGNVLEKAEALEFVPPEGTANVEVVVGGMMEVEFDIELHDAADTAALN